MTPKLIFNVVLLLIVSFIFIAGCQRVNISNYDGDGVIAITSSEFISYGYKVDFDNFNLKKPFSKKYKISNLPQIEKSINFGIAAKYEKDDLQNLLEGDLSLKVVNSDNQTLFDCSFPLKKWTYSMSKGNDNLYQYFVYFFSRDKVSSIEHNIASEAGEMTLFVNYEPKTTSMDIDGIIQLYAGGFK